MKQVLIIPIALFLVGIGRSAYAQTAYATDYHQPVETRLQRLPSVDDEPLLGLQPGTSSTIEQASYDPPVATGSLPFAGPPAETVEVAKTSPPAPPVKLWSGGCELGFNGSEGNSETLNFRFGFNAKRKTDANILDMDLDYHKKTADRQETANRMLLDSRYEWLSGSSPWTSFVHHTTEFDEFKAYDVRVTLDTGVGYQFIDNDATTLTGRFGSGVSHEIGGPEKSVVPELTWGLEFEHQLTERQKLRASTDFVPDVTDFGDFRLTTKLDWEVLLDEDWNLSLKTGILDRYDSTPNGAKANDLDYSITLLWGF